MAVTSSGLRFNLQRVRAYRSESAGASQRALWASGNPGVEGKG